MTTIVELKFINRGEQSVSHSFTALWTQHDELEANKIQLISCLSLRHGQFKLTIMLVGMLLIAHRKYMIAESPRANTISGMPSATFHLWIKMTCSL